jgi:group I intron endonuclease
MKSLSSQRLTIMFYVYKITNLINNKLYIGKTNDIHNRWLTHCSEGRRHRKQYPLYHAMNKYGEENFNIEILEELETEEECFKKEIYWIEFYKTNIIKYGHDFGYNLSEGGEGPSGHKDTAEQKLRKSLSKQSTKNSFYGKKHSAKSKTLISNAHKNKPISDEVKNKISAKLKGKPKSPETRAKMSAAFTGRIYTDIQRENMGKSKRGKPNYKKRGIKHHNATTTENDVINIRKYWDSCNNTSKDKLEYLMDKYKLTKPTIKQIVYKYTWKHLL